MQHEFLSLHKQIRDIKEDLRFKNEKLKHSCATIFKQEKKITELVTRYQFAKLETDIKNDEIQFYSWPDTPDILPLNMRIERYID